MSKLLHELENKLLPRNDVPAFWPGDELAVHILIKEGDKERIQVFTGICIGRRGSGLRETFTVRKLSYGEAVERVFPVHSPSVKKIEVIKSREKNRLAPRAKLYYLRKQK
ncbi:MAG TPA: 50S ribosomal protein L19 [bacterium]|nr:50S ribosomal protein L19 [bacterium]HOL66475.1 50S ribosomal protein L19 [bacterium]